MSATIWDPQFSVVFGGSVVTPIESANGTMITKPTDPAIINIAGDKWTMVATGGGQIAVNGVVDAITANVIRIEYANHLVYHQNTANTWYSKAFAAGHWVQTVAPVVPGAVTHLTVVAAIDALTAQIARIRADVATLTP
jgi:hypothetical protein